MPDTMNLTVTPDSTPFVLSLSPVIPFALSGTSAASISLTLSPSLTGAVDLRGPAPLKGIGGYVGGTTAADEPVIVGVAPYSFNINPAECRAEAIDAATAETVFTIERENAVIGTITFAAASTLGVYSFSSTAITKGDLVVVNSPSVADVTLASITFLLAS